MNIQIQTVHFDADNSLTDRIRQKLDKLKTFHDRIIDVEVYLILDNVAHQVKDKIAEIKVHVPRHSFFVKHQSKTFEESFDLAFDSMVNQIKRQKERRTAVQPNADAAIELPILSKARSKDSSKVLL